VGQAWGTARRAATRPPASRAAASWNHKHAIALYRWNIERSGAVYQASGVLEVVMRDAVDHDLRAWNAPRIDGATGRPHASAWLVDPAPLPSRARIHRDRQFPWSNASRPTISRPKRIETDNF
jgi:hypothetical protein